MRVVTLSPVNLARHEGVCQLTKRCKKGKTKWWILIFRDCTHWASQPIPRVMYEFVVDVIAEAFDMIYVVFNYCINFFDFMSRL